MSWLPQDPKALALTILFLSLLFAIPIGIFANLTTPRLQQWWAKRSEKSRAARLKILITQQREVHDVPTISEAEDHILSTAMAMSAFITLNTVCVLVGGSEIFIAYNLYRPQFVEITSVIFALYSILLIWFGIRLFGPLEKYRKRVSPRERETVAKEIKELLEIKGRE